MQISFLILSLGLFHKFTLAFLGIPPQPSDDDFYTIPEDIASYNEGDIVKWRDPPLQVRSVFYPINILGAWQFMVRSTNTQGQPIGIVGTILQPYDADPSKLLGYNYFMDSVDVNCAPSYSILFGASAETITSQLESVYMNAALSKGWNVLITDYEGPNAAFAAGKLAGMANLDGIRAALSSGDATGINSDAQVALWGYSGGTIPLAWAASLQPSYAPELSKNLIGIAVGGWVTNITLVLENIDGTPYAGFAGAGILGLASEYPEIQAQIFDHIVPLDVDHIKGLYGQCMLGSLLNYAETEFFKGSSPVFPEKENLFKIPQVHQMMVENILAYDLSRPRPNVPVFVYHGESDQVIPFGNSQRLYDTWCAEGIPSMEFAVSRSTGHIAEWIEGGGAALAWLSNRFDGNDPVSGCSRTERKSNLDYPGADLGFYGILSTTIGAVLQGQLGPLLFGGSPSSADTEAYNIIAGLVDTIGLIPLKR